jgi:hypothetical protein
MEAAICSVGKALVARNEAIVDDMVERIVTEVPALRPRR